MFGKLLKNDLKAQWHSTSVVLLCIIIVTAVAEIFAIVSDNQVLGTLAGLLVLFILAFACIVMVITVSMLYSKTMFGRAGYLTLTIPAKTSSLVWSKTISGLVWIFTVFALMIGSIFLWVSQVNDRFGEQVASAEKLLSMFGAPSFSIIFILVAIYVIYFAIAILLLVQCIYFGITLSNVKPFAKLGVLGAIIVTFASFFIIMSLTSSIAKALPIGIILTEQNAVFTTDIVSSVQNLGSKVIFTENITGHLLCLAAALGLNVPITYLIKEKVNIK